jgi:hypothetical protein
MTAQPKRDLHSVLVEHSKKANKQSTIATIKLIGVGLTFSFVFWECTSFQFILFEGAASHLAASLFYGMWLVLGFALCINPNSYEADAYVIPDETLLCLAEIDVCNKAAFKKLQEQIESQGCITLGQLKKFAESEYQERWMQKALSQPGVKSILAAN